MAQTPENIKSIKKSGASANAVLTVAVLVIAVVVIGGVLLFGGSNGPRDDHPELLDPSRGHALTQAPNSPVTVVEFLDYQCPACAAYYRNLTKQLEKDYEGRITFVTRNYPLDVHALAMPAAQAAEAAALQGRYEEMYHALFDNYESWALTPDRQDLSADVQRARAQFDEFARQIGLDLDRFHQDMQSGGVQQRIEGDRADGERLGVNSTPTIFINREKFEASGDAFAEVDQQLRDRLDQELAG